MRQPEGIVLSKEQEYQLRIIGQFTSGVLTREKAAVLMRCSQKTVTRLTARARSKGLSGLIHGNTGKCPSNKTDEVIKESAIELVESKYPNFNMPHARERIESQDSLVVGRSVFQRWCDQERLQKLKYRRGKPRELRDRFAAPGLLLQMDGSPHKWNGKNHWCLINAIEEARASCCA